MKRIIFLVLFCLSQSNARALTVFQYIDARAYSLGNTYSIIPGFSNPASFGLSPSRFISLQYMNGIGIRKISTYSGTANFSNRYLSTGLFASYHGSNSYNETLLSLNLYKKLSSHLSLGIRINYLNLYRSKMKRNKSVVTADAGIIVQPTDNFRLALLAINPLRIVINKDSLITELPVNMMFGIGYSPIRSILLTAEVEKDIAFPTVYKLGVEYRPISLLSLRGGMFAKPFTPTFGIGLHFQPVTIDLGFSLHAASGLRSCCGLKFNF